MAGKVTMRKLAKRKDSNISIEINKGRFISFIPTEGFPFLVPQYKKRDFYRINLFVCLSVKTLFLKRQGTAKGRT